MGFVNLLRRYNRVSALFMVLMLIYVGFTLLPVPDKRTLAHYHLSIEQERLLALTIVVPYVAIWISALAGYMRLRYYSDLISGDKDGRAFSAVSAGILVLALWLPTSAAVGSIFSYIYSRHQAVTASLVITGNYINLLILIVAFVLLDLGAKKFANVTRTIKNAPNQLLILGFLAFAALYTWLALSDQVRRHPGHNVLRATYYQPDWLIILTIIIPRLMVWFLGLQAVQNIFYYRHKVRGLIYKASLFHLSSGTGLVIAATILLSVLQSLSSQIEQLSLGLLLSLIYLLLSLIGAGYYFIAKGTKNLLQIEAN